MTQPDDNSNNETPLPHETHVAPKAPRPGEIPGLVDPVGAPHLAGPIDSSISVTGEAQPPTELQPGHSPLADAQPPALPANIPPGGDTLAGDPMAGAVPGFKPKRILPEDLRVSWSWPHLIVFVFFGFASLIVVQLCFVFYVSANRHLSGKQVEQVFASSPQLLVGSNLVWYALLFLFLYVTLAVLRERYIEKQKQQRVPDKIVPPATVGWRRTLAPPVFPTGGDWRKHKKRTDQTIRLANPKKTKTMRCGQDHETRKSSGRIRFGLKPGTAPAIGSPARVSPPGGMLAGRAGGCASASGEWPG